MDDNFKPEELITCFRGKKGSMDNVIEFKLEGSEYIELKNLLKVSGLCGTGGAAKNAIVQGEVLVDGVHETRKGLKVKSGQLVSFGKNRIKVI